MSIKNMDFKDFTPVVLAALAAGQAILEVYGREIAVDYKEDRSPLTEADRASHVVIDEALSSAFPGIPVLSEESASAAYSQRAGWDRYWLVDPLDGTKEFIKRNGEFTVNIALVDGVNPYFGVVYAPVPDVLYLGMAGCGAYRMSSGSRLSDCDDLSAFLGSDSCACCRLPLPQAAPSERPARIVASRSHGNPETDAFIGSIEANHGSVELVSIGSSLKLCLIASGEADLYPRIAPTMEWDTAAAHAVVTAAGGTVTAYDSGVPLRYNKPDLHNPHFVATSFHWRSAAGVSDGDL